MVLVVLLVVGDMAARKYAERQVAHVIRTHEPGSTAKVRIKSFPFVGRLAVSRQVQQISAHVQNVTVTTGVGSFILDDVNLTLRGVKVDLGPLAAGSDGAVTSIKSGTAEADMTADALSQFVKLPVTLGTGTAQVTVAGVKVPATVSFTKGNVLQLTAAGVAIKVTVPDIPVLPCLPAVGITPGHLQLSCTFNQVPAALLHAVKAA